MHRLALLTAAATTLALAPAALASPFHADAEVDPTAYALSGNSIHVGVGAGRVRVDLGNFAMRIPNAIHGHDGFDVSFDGYGAKLQVFRWSDAQRGAFAGVDAGVLRVLAARQGTDLAARQTQLGVGIHVGYRFAITEHVYATPWLGVGYDFGARDVTLANATYKASTWSVFPAVHVGYQFR